MFKYTKKIALLSMYYIKRLNFIRKQNIYKYCNIIYLHICNVSYFPYIDYLLLHDSIINPFPEPVYFSYIGIEFGNIWISNFQ